MVPSLEKRCVDFLAKTLALNNVFGVLDECLKWEVSAELLDKCKQLLQKQTKKVLQSEAFLSISLDCLIFLLEQDTLLITEGELLKRVSFSVYIISF